MFNYPAKFDQDPAGGYCVTFRDIPEAITQGDTIDEAHKEAVNALMTAIDFYFEDNRTVPMPSAIQAGEELVSMPLSVATKVMLLNLMIEQRKRPADLARAMSIKPQEVTRIMNIHHATKIDTLAAAFSALGKRLDFRVLPL